MPGAEATTVTDTDELVTNLDPESVERRSDAEIRNEWKKLKKEIESATYETDVDELHSGRNLYRAVELAFSHPESVSVSTEPLSRRYDLTEHVRGHFESLLNTPEHGRRLKRGRPDTERLLNACEMAYLYDAVLRFSPVTVVDTKIDGLERLQFVEVPEETHSWMGEVDIVWRVLEGVLSPEERIGEAIDRLYDERDEFVASAKEAEIFLPIRSEYVEDVGDKRATIEKRVERNAEVAPKHVHDYCFSRAVDRY